MTQSDETALDICHEQSTKALKCYAETSCYLTTSVFQRLLRKEFDCHEYGSMMHADDLLELIENPGPGLCMLEVRCYALEWNHPQARCPVHEFLIFPHARRMVQSYYRQYGRRMSSINRRFKRNLLCLSSSIDAYSCFVGLDRKHLNPDWFPLGLHVVRYVNAS